MLAELTLVPIGGNTHISEELAEVLKLIDTSGLPYELTPTATCIEGKWEEVMSLIRQCHERMRRHSTHVVTFIKIEDDADATEKLKSNVSSVERKAGRSLSRESPALTHEQDQEQKL